MAGFVYIVASGKHGTLYIGVTSNLEQRVYEHREGLTRLRQKLARNEAAILAHLNAVNEVANLLKNAIQNAEADGTYSAGAFGWAQS